MGIDWVKYNVEHEQLQQVLHKVDRSGDYCVHGKLVAHMPRLEVASAGMVSFPVPDFHADTLIRVAERAPYGRGPETVLDTSVRDCWQIDASKVKLGDAVWDDTFASILERVADGLGCPRDRLSARLYKLLVYETGGFFAAHRDSEKVDGMVATLVVSLPAAGSGGELVVRHKRRETVIDMCVGAPYELAFAAFYADCSHETRPLRDGHRVSLVYNLMLSGEDSGDFAQAPDFADQVEAISALLADWSGRDGAKHKIVWLLDHDYSEAGLSFETLKGLDDATARVIESAALRARCSLHAAILRIEESGAGEWVARGADDYDIDEIETYSCWLDSWAGPSGARPTFGKLPLEDGELLPSGALEGVQPDEKRVLESSGNAGVDVERSYRKAALVLWPRDKAVAALAVGGIDSALEYAEREFRRIDGDARSNAASADLMSQLIRAWRSLCRPDLYQGERRAGEKSRRKMLHLLASVGDEGGTCRFLQEIVLPLYSGGENDGLIEVAAAFGPETVREFLPRLVETKLAPYVRSVVDLTWRLWEGVSDGHEQAWLAVLGQAVQRMPQGLPRVLEGLGREWPRTESEKLEAKSVAQMLRLGWLFGRDRETTVMAGLLVQHPAAATPGRAIPEALSMIRSAGEAFSGKQGFWTLWRRAAEWLLERSADRPEPPPDWRVNARIDCGCYACRKLEAFCLDGSAETVVYPMRRRFRDHLELKIGSMELPIDYETLDQGRPYKFVCTKNRADYKLRLEEYADDIDHMRMLLRSPPAKATIGQAGRLIERLRSACSVAE